MIDSFLARILSGIVLNTVVRRSASLDKVMGRGLRDCIGEILWRRVNERWSKELEGALDMFGKVVRMGI